MQITLIRHLPTEWNVNTWLQGRQDIEILPITDRDQLEMVKNQNNLSRLQPFDHHFSEYIEKNPANSPNVWNECCDRTIIG